ncbi:MAG: polysaccharide biosynthesis/export family protein [Candidatus Acidiferrales bacterium]
MAMKWAVRHVLDCPRAKLVPFLSVMLLCALPALSARQNVQQKTETPQQTNEKIQELAAKNHLKPHDVPVGTGDLLHIEVFDVPELSRDVRVGDAGDISYPLIPSKITAAGLTPFQLEQKMEQLLIENGLVTHPQVSVFVKEQNSQPVSVVGAVQRPMVYQVIRPTTLLEILAGAGGITDDAGSIVIVTRSPNAPAARSAAAVIGASASGNSGSVAGTPTPDDPLGENPQIITIRLQSLLESGDSAYNILVYGGDVISVPRAGIVYVTGAGVSQPGGYVLQSHGEQITVLKAVALAHGLTGFAKADNAVIMRANPVTGQRDVIPVKIGQIEKQKTQDVAMNSNDVLYIPDSKGLKVLARGAEAAISIGSSVAIYRTAY